MIGAILSGLSARMWRLVAAIGAAFAALAIMYSKGRKDAKDKAKLKATEQALKDERLRDEIDDSTSGSDARDRLRSDWSE